MIFFFFSDYPLSLMIAVIISVATHVYQVLYAILSLFPHPFTAICTISILLILCFTQPRHHRVLLPYVCTVYLLCTLANNTMMPTVAQAQCLLRKYPQKYALSIMGLMPVIYTHHTP